MGAEDSGPVSATVACGGCPHFSGLWLPEREVWALQRVSQHSSRSYILCAVMAAGGLPLHQLAPDRHFEK